VSGNVGLPVENNYQDTSFRLSDAIRKTQKRQVQAMAKASRSSKISMSFKEKLDDTQDDESDS